MQIVAALGREELLGTCPEGTDDPSLAIYCQGNVLRSAPVPAGRYEVVRWQHTPGPRATPKPVYKMPFDRLPFVAFVTFCKKSSVGLSTVPQIASHRTYGTGPLLNRYLAMNCQVAIIQSLRDKVRGAHAYCTP
jgi:hypothetical protein